MTSGPTKDRWEPAPGLCVSERDGVLAILDVATTKIFVCNEVGTQIWARLSGKETIDELSGEIADFFGVSHERAKQDTCTFLMELERLRLVARRPA
jgi:Coenzyme PQQ synthesis protein D (PqqD)